MPRARWTHLAELELEEILLYVAFQAGRPNVAEQLNGGIRELADRLSQNPLLGESRPELGDGLRLFTFKRWAVVYRPSDAGVDIVGFVDAARDFGDYFRSR